MSEYLHPSRMKIRTMLGYGAVTRCENAGHTMGVWHPAMVYRDPCPKCGGPMQKTAKTTWHYSHRFHRWFGPLVQWFLDA